MKAAVLCPGPSLARTYKGRGDYDVVAGVNRAVHAAPCDWWCFFDDHPINQIPIRWFTSAHVHSLLEGTGRVLRGGSILESGSLHERFPRDVGGHCWETFSATGALVLAASRGATRIDVYGSDRTNQPDFDGVNLPSNCRDAKRWEHEAAVWDAVVKFLAERGCTVNRVREEGTP